MIGARTALRTSLKVDLSLVAPVKGVVTALPVVAVFAVGFALGGARAAVTLAIGANLIAVMSLVGAPRPSIRLAVVDALAMGVSVFVGSVTDPYLWLHALVLTVWCFGAGLLVSFGKTQAIIGTQAIIAFVVLGRFSGLPLNALGLGGLVAAGALVEVVALLILRLPPSLRFQRNRLADGFKALAELTLRHPTLSAIDVAATLDEAERALAAPSLFGRTDVRDLRAALDQAKRIRLELIAVAGLRARLSGTDAVSTEPAIGAILKTAAAGLNETADMLRHPRRSLSWRPAGEEYRAALAPLEEAFDQADSQAAAIVRQCVAYLDELGGQIRAAGNVVENSRSVDSRHVWRPHVATTPTWLNISQLRSDAAILRANLRIDSPALRHAIRLALAVPASLLLATWLSLPRGYWVPFSVAVILRPDYGSLFGRGLSRVIGTLAGALLAAVVVGELHPDPILTTALVALTAWAAYSTWAASFSVAIGFVTALVLILLSTSLSDTVGTAIDRLVDILLGGAIALVAYLVWPTSSRANVDETQSALFAALGDYLAVVVDLVEAKPVKGARVSTCSRATRLAWAEAEAAVDQSIQEPTASRTDSSDGRGLLAAAQRIVRALHALRIDAERGATVPAFDELDGLKAGFLQALQILTDWSATRSIRSLPELRPSYRAVENRLIELHAPQSIGLHLDELVNAIDTAAHLAGLLTPALSE